MDRVKERMVGEVLERVIPLKDMYEDQKWWNVIEKRKIARLIIEGVDLIDDVLDAPEPKRRKMADKPFQQETLDQPPRPMNGIVCCFPVPKPSQDDTNNDESDDDNGDGVQTLEFGPFKMMGIPVQALTGEPNIGQALVIEANDEGVDAVIPYKARGSTVFYFEDHAIKLGGFHLVQMERVFAYWPAPEES